MDFFYLVIEEQMSASGTLAALTTYYTDYNDALAKLYTILAAAAKSTIPYHSACIKRSDGIIIEGKTFDRRKED